MHRFQAVDLIRSLFVVVRQHSRSNSRVARTAEGESLETFGTEAGVGLVRSFWSCFADLEFGFLEVLLLLTLLLRAGAHFGEPCPSRGTKATFCKVDKHPETRQVQKFLSAGRTARDDVRAVEKKQGRGALKISPTTRSISSSGILTT